MPDFKFFDLDGKPVTPESLAGKVAVLDFWATGASRAERSSAGPGEGVREVQGQSDKVAFYAVSVDRPEVANKDLRKSVRGLEGHRADPARQGAVGRGVPSLPAFPPGSSSAPTAWCRTARPAAIRNMAEALPEKIDKLLAGENIYEQPLEEYQEQLKQDTPRCWKLDGRRPRRRASRSWKSIACRRPRSRPAASRPP